MLTFKMPLAASVAACAVLALATVAPARAEQPAVPYDRCDYMNHDSKAYKACIADAAQAKLRAEATPVAPAATPKPKPAAQPRS
jgi:hypothetical protein